MLFKAKLIRPINFGAKSKPRHLNLTSKFVRIDDFWSGVCLFLFSALGGSPTKKTINDAMQNSADAHSAFIRQQWRSALWSLAAFQDNCWTAEWGWCDATDSSCTLKSFRRSTSCSKAKIQSLKFKLWNPNENIALLGRSKSVAKFIL